MDLKKHLPDWDFVDTWAEIQKLSATTKARNISASNFTITPAVNQIELHPNHTSLKLVEYNTSRVIHSTGYSCLGSMNSPLFKNDKLRDPASRKGKTVEQVLIVWGTTKGWSVIPKSVNKASTKTNFDIDGLRLTEEETGAIDKMSERFKVCDGSFLPPEMHGKVSFTDDE